MEHRARRFGFIAALVILLGLSVLLSPLPFAVLGWSLSGTGTSHRVHEVTFGTLFLVSALGTVRLLRRPTPAALAQSVLPLWVMLLLVVAVDRAADPFIGLFIVVPAVAAILYPGDRFPRPRPQAVLVGLAAVATVPLVVYAGGQISTAVDASAVSRTVSIEGGTPEAYEAEVARVAADDEEQALLIHTGHWSAMGGFALVAVVLAWVASLRPRGWELLAGILGAAVAHFGAVSLSAPTDASAASTPWAAAAIAWGAAMIVAAIVLRGADGRTDAEATIRG